MHLLHLILGRETESTACDTSLRTVFDCSKTDCSVVNTIANLQNVSSALMPKHPLMPSTKILFLIPERANGNTVSGT
jgi:hypothetical protein